MNTTTQKEMKDLVEELMSSYEQYPATCNIDCQNRLNRDTILNILEMLRWVIFPGYFEKIGRAHV